MKKARLLQLVMTPVNNEDISKLPSFDEVIIEVLVAHNNTRLSVFSLKWETHYDNFLTRDSGKIFYFFTSRSVTCD